MPGFADLLVERGSVLDADLARVRDIQRQTGGRLPATLVRLGLATEDDVAAALATAAGAPLLSKADLLIDTAHLANLNPRFLRKRGILPFGGGEVPTLAMSDPEDTEAVVAIEFALGASPALAVATISDLTEALHAALGVEGYDEPHSHTGGAVDLERLLEGDSEAPIVRTVQRLLASAVDARASDVHIEPMARHVVVRNRVDGRLIEVETLPSAVAAPIASRIKVMAALDIAESRLPQDGRLRLTVRGRDIDVRVSTSPTAWGESIVLRLLGRTEVPLDIEKLGLPADALTGLLRVLERPHGIILVTGPTGSGKTTTLYAALNRLRRPEVKILTVEDPVEVMLDGVNQVQVRPEIELSYAATLRAFLRQDPDILMIGEIRDHETAEIALRAALTGHLVLSTLHTNSALGAFTRLADMGVEPYLTASTVIATIAQRLIRGLCGACCCERSPTVEEAAMFSRAGFIAPERIADPVGCRDCGHSGYRGRLPLIELVEVDEALRKAVRAGQVHVQDNLDRLLRHGLALVAEGQTSLAEVLRVVASA